MNLDSMNDCELMEKISLLRQLITLLHPDNWTWMEEKSIWVDARHQAQVMDVLLLAHLADRQLKRVKAEVESVGLNLKEESKKLNLQLQALNLAKELMDKEKKEPTQEE